MTTPPWHQLNHLRGDVRSGTLTLAEFAADLNAVRTGDAPLVYRDPAEFFARTYPTFNMKVLVRDVLQRLAGTGGKPVIRIQVAYGGGKTHTEIVLLHLAEHGGELGHVPTVREFTDFADLAEVPKARVALLPFDKFDVKGGLVVYGPDGRTRRVKTPWGALAYQLAGDAGFARLAEHERDYVAPAEPLLVDLLRATLAEGRSPLILMDETVWYYRGVVNADPRRLGLLKDFFQVLLQAVGRVPNAALVASLIASQVEANDQTGTECLHALEDVFRRMEEVTEPVARGDVAEVLRRRLFESVAGESERRPVIDAVLARMQRLPLRDSQKDQYAYNRLLTTYPFHPELLDVLYQKWTQLPSFHRTRGALRLMAQALREQDGSDPSPLIGPHALLSRTEFLSPALGELINASEDHQAWTPILGGELEKARDVQRGFPSLKQREVEQAVIATFLHSQPTGQKADPPELYALMAHPDVDPAALSEGLKKWREISWFLAEDPDAWQLGTNPNLTHMHVRAMERLSEEVIDDELRARIQSARELAEADEGVQVHRLPQGPRDVGDTVDLHYIVLGPECAVEPGRPVPVVVENYFDRITGPENRRTYRNSIVALAPDLARLAGLRERVRRYLGWRAVETGEEQRLLSDLQRKELGRRKLEAQNGFPEAVRATYSVVLAVDERGHVEGKALPSGLEPPFDRIKKLLTESERLLTSTLDPELLLPESYLELWGPNETYKRARDLISAFAQFPRLPRLLRPRALLDTLARGVREGQIVLRLRRPDGSAQTWWRIEPDSETLARPELEVMPSRTAELVNLAPDLLAPGRLEGMWPASEDPLCLKDALTYFDGERAPRLADDDVLRKAIGQAVQRGLVMARAGRTSYLREDLPPGIADDKLDLLNPPPALHAAEISQSALPDAWADRTSTAAALWEGLSRSQGYQVPWVLFRDSLTEALSTRSVELAPGSDPWPASIAGAASIRLRLPTTPQPPPDVPYIDPKELIDDRLNSIWTSGTTTLRAIKEAIETYHGKALDDEAFERAAQTALNRGLIALADDGRAGSLTLSTRVRLPHITLFAEAQLKPREIQDFAEIVQDLFRIAPELAFAFRFSISAEGARPSGDTIAALNEVLGKVSRKWKLE